MCRSLMRVIPAVASFAFVLSAQHGSTTQTNPFIAPEDREAGAILFKNQCAACHGPNGTGGAAGPNLTGALRRRDTDESLFQIVAKGIPGTPMPAFAGNARQIWQLVTYVRSLSVGKSGIASKGDATRGARLFVSSGCANCHSIFGQGSSAGPDLSEVARYRTLGQLQRSILDPGEDIDSDYWMLRARTRSGQLVSGVRLNEDTFSFQYLENGRLRSVLKRDLVQSEVVRTSPMPSYRDKLSSAEIADVIAYLGSALR
jgi:putative heme-binding domain-containing protein